MRRRDLLAPAAAAALFLTLFFPAGFSSRTAAWSFGDLYSYHFPLRRLVGGALEEGRLPFWNPYIFCGLPLGANPQTALFYPVSLLSSLLPGTPALFWDCAFHWLWGWLGMALLARRGGLDAAGAALLSTCFCLSPFVVYRIAEGIPTLLSSLAWVPWCWLALGSGRGGLLAAVWSLQFLSGHQQFMIINAAGMALWLWTQGEALSSLMAEGAPVLALCAVQWVPTRQFLGLSVRRALPAAFLTGYSVDLAALRTWLDPRALGDPLRGTYAGVPSVFLETCGVFVGACGLGLAAAGLALGRRRALGAGALIALGLFLAAGGRNPIYRAAAERGLLGAMRTPARFSFLCLWGLLLSAGLCLKRSLGKVPAFFRVLLVAAAAFELVRWDARFLHPEDAGPYLVFNRDFAERLGGRPVRVMTDPELANPNKSMLYRAMNASGYEAFYPGAFAPYAARSEGAPAADASRTYMTRFDRPGWSRAGVAWYFGPNGAWRENPAAWPLASFTGARGLKVDAATPERWRISGVAGMGPLTVAVPRYPGWRAWLDGREVPIGSWEEFFQRIELSSSLQGKPFELRLRFEPSHWPWLALAAALSWAAWLAAWAGLLP